MVTSEALNNYDEILHMFIAATSVSDKRSVKGQIVHSEPQFFLRTKLQYSAAFTTALSLTCHIRSPRTIPVSKLLSSTSDRCALRTAAWCCHQGWTQCTAWLTHMTLGFFPQRSAWFQRSCNALQTPSYSSYVRWFLWCNVHYSDRLEFEPIKQQCEHSIKRRFDIENKWQLRVRGGSMKMNLIDGDHCPSTSITPNGNLQHPRLPSQYSHHMDLVTSVLPAVSLVYTTKLWEAVFCQCSIRHTFMYRATSAAGKLGTTPHPKGSDPKTDSSIGQIRGT